MTYITNQSRLIFKPKNTVEGEFVLDDLTMNKEIRSFCESREDWWFADWIKVVYALRDCFNQNLGLNLKSPSVIKAEPLPRSVLGTYQPDRDGLGMRYCITLNLSLFAAAAPRWRWAEVELHELIHQYQEENGLIGKSADAGYHNKGFRDLAHSFGLLVNDRGRLLGIEPDSSFVREVVAFGLGPVPTGNFAELYLGSDINRVHWTVNDKVKKTKNLKWSCGCTNIRAAVEVQATCHKCGRVFRPALPQQCISVNEGMAQ